MLIETAQGLYCPDGDFHIDPWGAVPRALITHAHGDHARFGSAAYLCSEPCLPLLRRRFGTEAAIESIGYGLATVSH
jgi:putative mRNA 3-end processing factor